MKIPLLLLAAVLAFTSCQPNNQASSGLGEVKFAFTASPEALPSLKKGWLLLHSFEYDDARTAFREAQTLDPGCAMAYWGEAMSHHFTLWEREETEAGRLALMKWKEVSEEHPVVLHPVETGLLEAAWELYGSGEQAERNRAFAESLGKLYSQHPQDQEVASFYALALLGTVSDARDYEVYDQAAGIARTVMQTNDRHPGALHYLIHAYDDPDHAHLALEAAETYATVAPDAAHALHMPSHIFVARGMWNEVVTTNVASYGSSVERMKRLGMNNNARGYHSLAWLTYGLLQQERWTEVDAIMKDMLVFSELHPSRPARSYLMGMVATYLAHQGTWSRPFEGLEIPIADLELSLQGLHAYWLGRSALEQGKFAEVQSRIRELEGAILRTQNTFDETSSSACGAFEGGYGPTLTDIEVARILLMELKALQARAQGKEAEAFTWLREAAALEITTDFEYGPPTVVEPANELLARWLLEAGQPEEALAVSVVAERRTPGRRLTLQALEAAHKALGHTAAADSLGNVLQAQLRPSHPEVQYKQESAPSTGSLSAAKAR